jgi:ABC-type sugar transport system ATPase subunit
MSSLKLKNVRKVFGNTTTIHGIDLEISAGEFVVFVGPSGCGKSTLLRMIAGLESVSEGSIAIGARDVTHAAPSARNVAMVFQSYALYPHMTVMENLTFGMRMRGVAKDIIKQKVDMAVEILRLTPYLDRKPGALSGGQCQRVAIGRALVQEPDVFLFDEPLSNLDAELRLSTRVEIAALHKRLGKTMIYVTHDQVEAMTLADKIVVLRDGRIEQVGKPLHLYRDPANAFVAGFIGSPAMNFLDIASDAAIASLNDAARTALRNADRVAKIGVRPEHLTLSFLSANTNTASGVMRGVASSIERLGASCYVYVNVQGFATTLTVQLDGSDALTTSDALKPGAEVSLDCATSDVYLFDANGARVR